MCDYVNMFGDHLSVIIHECEIKTVVLVCVFTVNKEFFVCLSRYEKEQTKEGCATKIFFNRCIVCVCVCVFEFVYVCVCDSLPVKIVKYSLKLHFSWCVIH